MAQQARSISDAVSGRATGVLFFAGFGSLWLYNGLSAMRRMNPVGAAAVGVIFFALALPAAMLLRASSNSARPHGGLRKNESAESAEISRAFARINLYQWAAIAGAVVLFNILQRPEYLAPVITFIVGAHLVPLARILRYRAHCVTAALLMLWATAVVAALPGDQMPSIGAVGTAAILLGSAACTLTLAYRTARSGAVANKLHLAEA